MTNSKNGRSHPVVFSETEDLSSISLSWVGCSSSRLRTVPWHRRCSEADGDKLVTYLWGLLSWLLPFADIYIYIYTYIHIYIYMRDVIWLVLK